MHHVKIKTERTGELHCCPLLSHAFWCKLCKVYQNVGYVSMDMVTYIPTVIYVISSADVEGSGARSKLDAVLQGLVERTENERSVI